VSLRPPPKMLSRLRDEEGRAYHDATMQKRRADAMATVRLKEALRLAKLRAAGLDGPSRSGSTAINFNTPTVTIANGGAFNNLGAW